MGEDTLRKLGATHWTAVMRLAPGSSQASKMETMATLEDNGLRSDRLKRNRKQTSILCCIHRLPERRIEADTTTFILVIVHSHGDWPVFHRAPSALKLVKLVENII
jgi:hypothetical protein